MRTKLIGIHGRAGAGKDTVADWLVRERGYVRVSLADPMKRFCAEVFGFSEEQLWGPSEHRNAPDARWDGLTPRHALQQLGTEWGRAMHPDVWVRYAIATAQRWAPSPVVISDVRFQNEVDAIVAAGGCVIEVRRPGLASVGEHVSEAGGLTGVAEVVQNAGTLEDLHSRLAALEVLR